eukprot:6177473-Pleurochrysis_carterae.AAC.2
MRTPTQTSENHVPRREGGVQFGWRGEQWEETCRRLRTKLWVTLASKCRRCVGILVKEWLALTTSQAPSGLGTERQRRACAGGHVDRRREEEWEALAETLAPGEGSAAAEAAAAAAAAAEAEQPSERKRARVCACGLSVCYRGCVRGKILQARAKDVRVSVSTRTDDRPADSPDGPTCSRMSACAWVPCA